MGRYFSQRDMNLVHSLNAELMGDIMEVLVDIFKVSAQETKVNLYNETDPNTGKWYLPAVRLSVIVDRPEMTTEHDDFGPNRAQVHTFKFREKMCKQVDYYPEIGDIIYWNDRYYELDNVVQEQLLGGQTDKSHSIICTGHYTRLSFLNITEGKQ